MLEDDDRAKFIFLSLLQARVGSSLVSHLGNLAPEAVLRTPVVELAGRAKISQNAARAIEELQRVFDPDRVQEHLAAKGIEALTPADEAYPKVLRSIPDPPPALFVKGAVPNTPAVALVGSRKASTTGIETARALGLALAERGVCVVSGLALGVDAAAHEGALEAGGLTVGVLGCGIDIVKRQAIGRGSSCWARGMYVLRRSSDTRGLLNRRASPSDEEEAYPH